MAMDTDGMPYRETHIDETVFGRGLTIAAMTEQIREVNIEKGWRAPDGGLCPGQTFGDYIALAHTELSEALEAYRDHRLADATTDVTTCALAGPEMCATHDRHISWCRAAQKPEGVGSEFADLLIRLLDMADVFGIDLEREYVRKLAYNRTRAFQHGGRTLADPTEVALTAQGRLMQAMPIDPHGWWTGDEVGAFIDAWQRLELPALTLQNAEGNRLELLTTDLERAREMLGGWSGVAATAIELDNEDYVVWIGQDAEKETKDA